jgi:hypothetical protein
MPYYPPAGGSGLPTTGGTMTGTITSTIGTVTANTPMITGTQTWNNGAVTFYGIYHNVTNTASGANSRLLSLNVSGIEHFRVNKDGAFGIVAGNWSVDASGNQGLAGYIFNANGKYYLQPSTGLRLSSDRFVAWANTTSADQTLDTGLYRNAAGVVEVNNGTAGTFRDIKVRSIIIDGAPSTAGAGQIAIGADTRTTIGANGGASALTALPVGYIDIDIAGSAYQIPYYNRGA